MADKLIKSAACIIESRRGLASDISGVISYVLAAGTWNYIDLKFEDLPVALTFLKALTLLATGYWGAFSFAKITYSCTKRRGLLLGGLLTAVLLIGNKLIFMHTDYSIIDGAIRSIGMLGVAGGILGWLLACSSKAEEQNNDR